MGMKNSLAPDPHLVFSNTTIQQGIFMDPQWEQNERKVQNLTVAGLKVYAACDCEAYTRIHVLFNNDISFFHLL